jgi:hypothetical protein
MTKNNSADMFSIEDVEIYRQVKRIALKKEYSAGTHDGSNIRIVCTPCHTQIHLRRAYMGLDAEKTSEVQA